jgi:hypothetical protein
MILMQMTLDYKLSADNIKERLLAAHNPSKAVIRDQFFKAEYDFFRSNIIKQNVLVAGSGLGHDSFELAGYNLLVVGVESLEPLIEYSRKRAEELRVYNVIFHHKDITKLPYVNHDFNSAVLNMGTIGNVNDKNAVLDALLKSASKVYFDFYPPTAAGIEKRRRMYSEEQWKNVRVKGTSIVSDDGLDSASLSQEEIDILVSSLGAKVKYYPFHDFSVMAEAER